MADPQQPVPVPDAVASTPAEVTELARVIRMAAARRMGSDPFASLTDGQLVEEAYRRRPGKVGVFLSPQARALYGESALAQPPAAAPPPAEAMLPDVKDYLGPGYEGPGTSWANPLISHGVTMPRPVPPVVRPPASMSASSATGATPPGVPSLAAQEPAQFYEDHPYLGAATSALPRVAAGLGGLALAAKGAGLGAAAGGAVLGPPGAVGGAIIGGVATPFLASALAEYPIQRLEQTVGLRNELNPKLALLEGTLNAALPGVSGASGGRRIFDQFMKNAVIGATGAGSTYALESEANRGPFDQGTFERALATGFFLGGGLGSGTQAIREGWRKAKAANFAWKGSQQKLGGQWTPDEFQQKIDTAVTQFNQHSGPGSGNTALHYTEPVSQFTFIRDSVDQPWRPAPLERQPAVVRARVTEPPPAAAPAAAAPPAETAAPAPPPYASRYGDVDELSAAQGYTGVVREPFEAPAPPLPPQPPFRSRYEDMGTLGNLQSRDPHPLETATLQGLGRRLMGQQPEMFDPTLQRVLATGTELPEGYTPYGLYRAVQDTQGGIAPPLRLKTDPATAQVPPPPGRGIMRVKPPGEAAAATPTEPVAPAGASPSRPGTPKGRVCAVCGKPGGQPYSRRLGIGKDAPVERDYVHRQHVRQWLNAGDRAGAAASPKGNTALPRSAGQAFGGEMSDLDHYVANAVSNEAETAATGEAPIRALYNAAFYADQYGVDVETFRKAIRDTYGVAEEKPVTVRAYHGSPERKAFVPDPRRAVETSGAVFLADNEDVASTFTLPREYGESVYYDAAGLEIKPGRVTPLDVTLQRPLHLSGPDAQKFIDDTTYQGKIVRQAKAAGHDGIVAEGVLEGIGERYRTNVYAVFDSAALRAAPKTPKKAAAPVAKAGERGSIPLSALTHLATPTLTGALAGTYGAFTGTSREPTAWGRLTDPARWERAAKFATRGALVGAGLTAGSLALNRYKGGITRERATVLMAQTPPEFRKRLAPNPPSMGSLLQRVHERLSASKEEIGDLFEPFHVLEREARNAIASLPYVAAVRQAIAHFKEAQNELRNLREGIKQDFHYIFSSLKSPGDMQEFWRIVAYRRDASLAERSGAALTESGRTPAEVRAEIARSRAAWTPEETAAIDEAIKRHDAVMRRVGLDLVQNGDLAASTVDINSDYFPHMVAQYFQKGLPLHQNIGWRAREARGAVRAAMGGPRETLHDYVGVVTKYLHDVRADLVRSRTQNAIASSFDVTGQVPVVHGQPQVPIGYKMHTVRGINPANQTTYIIPEVIDKELTRRFKVPGPTMRSIIEAHNVWKSAVLNLIYVGFTTTNFLGDAWRSFTYQPVSHLLENNPARMLLAYKDALGVMHAAKQGRTMTPQQLAALPPHQQTLLAWARLLEGVDIGTGAATAEVGAQVQRNPGLRRVARDPLLQGLGNLSHWQEKAQAIQLGLRDATDVVNGVFYLMGTSREWLEALPRTARFLSEVDQLARMQGMPGTRLTRGLQSGRTAAQQPVARAKVSAEVTRQIMIDYSALTQEERTLLRGFLLPFYAFYKHNTKAYTPGRARYPVVDPATLDVKMSKGAGLSAITSALGAAATAYAFTSWWNEWVLPRAVAAYTGNPADADTAREAVASLRPWQRYQPHVLLPHWRDPKTDEMTFFYLGLQTPLVAAMSMMGLGGGFQRIREVLKDPADASTIMREQWDESYNQIRRNTGGALSPLIQIPFGLAFGQDLRTGANISSKEMNVKDRIVAHGWGTMRQIPLMSNMMRAQELGGEGLDTTAKNMLMNMLLGGSKGVVKPSDLRMDTWAADIAKAQQRAQIEYSQWIKERADGVVEDVRISGATPAQLEASFRYALDGKGPAKDVVTSVIHEALTKLARENRTVFGPLKKKLFFEYNLDRFIPEKPTPAGISRMQHLKDLQDARTP